MKISRFKKRIKFESPVAGVYAFFIVKGAEEIPFYIGETSSFTARIGDYQRAHFSAITDFKVGQAVRYLRERGYSVVVGCSEHPNRRKEEKRLIQEAKEKQHELLNGLSLGSKGKEQACACVQEWCDKHLLTKYGRQS